MRKLVVIFLLICLGLDSVGQTDVLMPMPEKVVVNDGEFRISREFNVQMAEASGKRIGPAVERFVERLKARSGLDLQVGFNTDAKPDLVITCEMEVPLQLGIDESYGLAIDWKGVHLRAKNDIGILRGLQTLQQLLTADEQGFYLPYIEINDAPRFPWRGLLIDVCRHWQPIDVVKRNLDAMEVVKMNVLHLHLTEDQGFRVESKLYPALHEKGSNGNYFTQTDLIGIVDYANARGIRVIPEFDMPGHTTSWFVGHPELASAPGPYSIEEGFGVMDPTMDPSKEDLYEFLDGFLGEMAAIFPDMYMHIGGDENNGKQWAANEQIQKFMKKNKLEDAHALQAFFNSKVLEILKKHGKRMVGWDEVLQPGISKDIVIQSWRGQEGLFHAAREGYDAILSNGYYIDLSQSAEFHYLNDPIPVGTTISAEESAHILGGEATMWTEMVTEETIDSRIWPRTAAIAERLWSPQDVRDVEDMYRRLVVISQRLEEAGAEHISNREMMMRRAANGNDIAQLKKLLDLVAPLQGYERHHQGKDYNTDFPFNRAPDMAIPDPPLSREISRLVTKYLDGSETAATELTILFRSVLSCELIRRQYSSSPALRELDPLIENVMSLANIGLRAIKDIDAQNGPTGEESLSYSMKEIEKARTPQVECYIPWASSIEELVQRSAEQ